MKFEISSQDPLSSIPIASEVLVVPIASSRIATDVLARLKSLAPTPLKHALKKQQWSASSKEALTLYLPTEAVVQRVLLLPLAEAQSKEQQWLSVGVTLQKLAASESRLGLLLDSSDLEEQQFAAEFVVRGYLSRDYRFESYRSKKKKASFKGSARSRVHSLCFYCGAHSKKHKGLISRLRSVEQSFSATYWARDLVNTPAGDLTPLVFAAAVQKRLKAAPSTFKLRVLRKPQLEKLKAGALLGVAKGSAASPCMLHLQYRPATTSKKSSKRIVLIGKGVTFDSGGLSMKTPTGMADMKCDMAGAAAVAGVFAAMANLTAKERPQHEVHGLIPLVENMVSGAALRPGDVVRTISGKTIEVVNTDAEGRLILADALEFSARLKPDIIIDAATLTGACLAALGEQIAGLFSEDDTLSQQLLEAARTSADSLWRLPLGEAEYRSLLKSDIADMKNSAGTFPGASLAALFLKEFVPENCRWAHIDIAGPAFVSKEFLHRPKGATGFGVQLFLEFLSKTKF